MHKGISYPWTVSTADLESILDGQETPLSAIEACSHKANSVILEDLHLYILTNFSTSPTSVYYGH